MTTIEAERTKTGPDWTTLPHYEVWQKLKAQGAQNEPDYKDRITAFLGKLACQERWRDGAVADGVIRRALETGFAGEIAQIERRISNPSCPASGSISPELKKDIVDAIEERDNPLSGSSATITNTAESTGD
ncbi:MAG: hypothetical protein ACR2O4_14985 [Hyphomicrobiaceae bacterium]